jgi:hypothetical protein
MSLKTTIATYRVKRLLTERRQLTELKTYEGKLARIVGKPFATRLDKAYPKSQLGRRALIKAIEMSNNAEMMGYAKANVNGESLRGFYFRATDGSAKGVAWQAAVDVYRAKQVGPDVFFAHDSRIGTKVQAESEEPTEPDTIDDEEEDDEEECECGDCEDCDCEGVEEAGSDKLRAKFAAVQAKKTGPDARLSQGCPPGQKMTFGKCAPVKHANLRAKHAAFKAKTKPSRLSTSLDSDGDSEITEKVGTKLIQRALRGLGSGASEVQVAKELQKSGVSKEEAFLAIKAAKILVGDVMKGESKDTKPLPPLHKWPVKIVGKGKVEYTLGNFKVTEVGEPPGSGLYIYELFAGGKSAGKFNNQREVVSRAQALRGK